MTTDPHSDPGLPGAPATDGAERAPAATNDATNDARSGAVAAVAAVVLLLALFHPILAVRTHFYLEQPRYSHCLLLPVVSAIWVWERWDTLRAVPRGPSRAGVAATCVAVLLFLYGRVQNMNLLQHAALLLAIPSVVAALWGGALVRRLTFPVAYLLLTVPLPKTWDDAITLPLQSIATTTAESVFDLFGWVVVRQGNVLHLPGLKLLVEDACSGIHSLYALVALGVAFAAFVERPAWLRATLVVATVPIAVTANSVRVIATGWLAYKVDPAYAEGISHSATGMIVFVVGLLLLLALDWCLRPDPPPAESAGGAAG